MSAPPLSTIKVDYIDYTIENRAKKVYGCIYLLQICGLVLSIVDRLNAIQLAKNLVHEKMEHFEVWF
mgnify:CR=1 FL=1